jgi:hypothetical protein
MTPQILDRAIDNMIKHRFLEGQLDECELTLRDLSNIREAFLQMLIGIHHQRIRYPEQLAAEQASEPASGQAPGQTPGQTPEPEYEPAPPPEPEGEGQTPAGGHTGDHAAPQSAHPGNGDAGESARSGFGGEGRTG